MEEGKGGNLEEDFPISIPFHVEGEDMVARIYAFQGKKAETYRTNEGVIFSINGQTHGYIPKSIFGRKKVKMHRLANALLVTVDCTNISIEARENLFMNSRDRLSNGSLRKAIEKRMEDILASNTQLRELRDRRRMQEISDRLEDSKPLEDVLSGLLKTSPSLAALFLKGKRLSNPHKRRGGKNGENGGTNSGKESFAGKPYPTFFKFHKKQQGEALERTAEIGRHCRVKFDTDVNNDYFVRTSMPGRYEIRQIHSPDEKVFINSSLALHNGFGNWSMDIPDELNPGDIITLECVVSDEVNPDGFTNILTLTMVPKSDKKSTNTTNRKSRTSGGEAKGDELDDGITLPEIVKVVREEWGTCGFDERSATAIVRDVCEEQDNYTFYINVDNIYLRTDMKASSSEANLVEAKFVYANVLSGLAIIQDLGNKKIAKSTDAENDPNGDDVDIDKSVRQFTRAMAPFYLPMIDNLGELSEKDTSNLGEIGDSD